VEQEPLALPGHMSSLPVFSGVRVARSLVFCVMFCRSSFVLFLLTIVSFFDLRLLITPLVSSNFSYMNFGKEFLKLKIDPKRTLTQVQEIRRRTIEDFIYLDDRNCLVFEKYREERLVPILTDVVFIIKKPG